MGNNAGKLTISGVIQYNHLIFFSTILNYTFSLDCLKLTMAKKLLEIVKYLKRNYE